jgi:hypothetical protein
VIDQAISRYMAAIGKTGGQKSRRKLDREQARQMVRIREARRAYKTFHSRCFWSSPAELQVGKADLPWIIEQLQRHGGRAGWEKAEKLCR